jgi:uncharacterized membrane protein YphA (DoxX/SURF4 family)
MSSVSSNSRANPEHAPWRSRLDAWLSAPVNGASLAVFRFCIGVIMVLEAWTLCVPSASTFNEVPLTTFYTGANLQFRIPYPWFEWVPLLPPFWIHVVVGALALGGVCLAIGLFHRVAATLVFLSWGYLYVVESTRTYWMSYYYLELLVAFLLIWMPASRRFSVDAWLFRKGDSSTTVPRWTLVLLQAQLVVTYFYAGLAKVNSDWLIDGEPVRFFLSQARIVSELGPKLSASQLQTLQGILHHEGLVYLISWVGAGFDLAIGFLLLARRTRIFGMILILIFHGTNHFIIFKDIHWFPFIGITSATIFFDPDWPERAWRWIRSPRVAKPDWRYFVAGGVLFPGVGASLGWSLKPTPVAPAASASRSLSRWMLPLVAGWIAWQSLNPLRQFLSGADSRLTWEGLSFCWRLKAEVYRCIPSQYFLGDSGIISTNADHVVQIHWNAWKGEPVMYRRMNPTKVDWTGLPELVVTFEPQIGERILFNPLSGSMVPHTEQESVQRIRQLWQERYGRAPQSIRRTAVLGQITDAYAASLRAHGVTVASREDALERLQQTMREGRTAEIQPLLRRLQPFALEGAAPVATPLFLIEDPLLMSLQVPTKSSSRLPRVNRSAWKPGPENYGGSTSGIQHSGGEPMLVLTTETLLESGTEMPAAFLQESQDRLGAAPQIRWNPMSELTQELRMHVSLQPFLLRRYARHVADLWEKDHGRRPAVFAMTGVSLNGRPVQPVVDPNADLTRVAVRWWGHNSWIRDLETPRVPKGGIPQLTGP